MQRNSSVSWIDRAEENFLCVGQPTDLDDYDNDQFDDNEDDEDNTKQDGAVAAST